MNKNTVFAIGVIGGLVGYACGVLATPGTAVAQQEGASNGSSETPAHDAGASPAGPPSSATPVPPALAVCQQWQVALLPSNTDGADPGLVARDVPEGWEPYGFDRSWGRVMLRRCVR